MVMGCIRVGRGREMDITVDVGWCVLAFTYVCAHLPMHVCSCDCLYKCSCVRDSQLLRAKV